jgi:hypothetical protein
MAISACLHPQAGAGGGGQVVGHQRRGAAQEGERAAQHAAAADGDELWQSVAIGFFQHADGIAALGRRFLAGMAGARHRVAQRFAGDDALVTGKEALNGLPAASFRSGPARGLPAGCHGFHASWFCR